MLKQKGQAQDYPFHGFVIENVNDSVTMARAGVWADHIQVTKLALLLQRPIQLVRILKCIMLFPLLNQCSYLCLFAADL